MLEFSQYVFRQRKRIIPQAFCALHWDRLIKGRWIPEFPSHAILAFKAAKYLFAFINVRDDATTFEAFAFPDDTQRCTQRQFAIIWETLVEVAHKDWIAGIDFQRLSGMDHQQAGVLTAP